jgi:hypothetical protein
VADLATIARRYVEARDEVERLKAERDACVCDYEPREVIRRGMLSYDPPLRVRSGDYRGVTLIGKRGGDDAATAPCWRAIVADDHDMRREVEALGDGTEEGWCEPCTRRQALHEQLRAVRRTLPGRLSALISHTRATVGPKRLPKACPPVAPATPVAPAPIPDEWPEF